MDYFLGNLLLFLLGCRLCFRLGQGGLRIGLIGLLGFEHGFPGVFQEVHGVVFVCILNVINY